MDPDYSVLPLLLPRQQLFFSKSSPHHCLLLLDVPCLDEKILLMRYLTCACQETASFCFASPLALLPTCLPTGHRSKHHKPALFQLSSRLPLSSSRLPLSSFTSSHLCGAASCSCEPELPSGTTLPVGTGRLVARLLIGGASPAQLISLLPPGATLINISLVFFFIIVLRSLSFLRPH